MHNHQQDKRKCKSKSNRKEVIRLAIHTYIIQFLYEILKPILVYKDHGFVVQLGKDEKAELICAYPFIALFAGDNKQQNILCNIKSTTKSKGRKCRCCVDNECYLYGRDRNKIPLRDQKDIEKLTNAADKYIFKKYKNHTRQQNF